MKTLQLLQRRPPAIPAQNAWVLTDLAERKGRQDLFTTQSPQKLKVLREHAIIESAISSNRIEGVGIDRRRIKAVVLGRGPLHDRNEEEVRNYQNALAWIHGKPSAIPFSAPTIRRLHRTCKEGAWNAGRFKVKDGDIIEPYPDGRSRVRFRTVKARQTPAAVDALVRAWGELARDRVIPGLLLLGASNLDLLCIHPFRDGNGRVSRLALLLQLYHLGYEVGRYISLERLIERHKARYYETLEQSSLGWHDSKHDPWPYIGYLLFILGEAYKEFEDRVGRLASPKGAKTELIEAALRAVRSTFTLRDIENACPGVSRDMVRKVLKDLQRAGKITCKGRGPGARWEKR